jgi:hypothetical protein
MGMVGVQEDWVIVFLSKAPHQSGYLPHAEKFPFSLGGANRYRDFELLPGGHYRVQQNQVRHVEVAHRHSVLFALLQSISQSLHAGLLLGIALWVLVEVNSTMLL